MRGKAFVELEAAHKIGEVDSICLKTDEQRMAGLWVRARQSNDRLALASPNMRSIGKEAIDTLANKPPSVIHHFARTIEHLVSVY